MIRLSPKAEALLLSFEGWDVPWRWPGEKSGITLPIGYDLGYEEHFEKDWSGLLPAETMGRLRRALGVTGERARALAPSMRGILIPRTAAIRVFEQVTIPRQIAKTLSIWPLADSLPPDALGALVSVVYNRGTSLTSDRRREMRNIRVLMQEHARHLDDPQLLKKLAAEVRSMARLWPDNKNSDGDLHDRRIQEARLIEHALD